MKIQHQWFKMCFLIMLCMVWSFMGCRLKVQASSQANNRIVVLLKDGDAVLEGVELEIYQVAAFSGKKMVLTSEFEGTQLSLNEIQTKAEKSAELVEAFIMQEDFKGTAQSSAVSESDGRLWFQVEDGVYFVRFVEDKSKRNVEVTPFLVTMPVTGSNGEAVRKIECKPKCTLTQIVTTQPPTTEVATIGITEAAMIATTEEKTQAVTEKVTKEVTTEWSTVKATTTEQKMIVTAAERPTETQKQTTQMVTAQWEEKEPMDGNMTLLKSKTGDAAPIVLCWGVLVASGLMVLWIRKK